MSERGTLEVEPVYNVTQRFYMIPPFNPNQLLFQSQLHEVQQEIAPLDLDCSFKDFERFCLTKLDDLDNANPYEIHNLENLNQFLNCHINSILERFNPKEQFAALKILFTITKKIKNNFDYEIKFFPYVLKSPSQIAFFFKNIENNQAVLKIEINDRFNAVGDLFLEQFKEIKEHFSEDEIHIVYTIHQKEKVRDFLNIFGNSVKELYYFNSSGKLLNQFLENCPRLNTLEIQNSGEIDEIILTGHKELTCFTYHENFDVKKTPIFHWSESIVCLNLTFQIPFTIHTLPLYLTELSIKGPIELITASLSNLVVFNAFKNPLLKELPFFSSSLKILTLIQCCNLNDLKNIPSAVEILSINGLEKLETIDQFPTHLKELFISKCLNLKRLPPFPTNLERLEIRFLNSNEEFPIYPQNLNLLFLGDNLPFDKLPKTLPKNLKWFLYNKEDLGDLAYQMHLLKMTLLLDKKFTLELMSNVFNLFESNEITKNQYEEFINHVVKKLPFNFIYDSISEIQKVISFESFFLFHLKIWNQDPFKYLEMPHPIYISPQDFLQNKSLDALPALEILSKKINLSKLNLMMEKSHLKKESLIPSDYESINIEELSLGLFYEINFDNPKKTHYLDLTHLKDGKRSISQSYLKDGLFKLISNIKEKKIYVGVPIEPIQRQAYYATIEKQLKQLLALIKNAFLKKQDLDTFLTARTELIKIAIAGHYCGARWFNDPKDAIKVMTGNLIEGDEFFGIEELFEKWIKQDLFQQIEYFRKELAKVLGISNEIHIHNQIGRFLSAYGIVFEEGTFQLNDPILPVDKTYLRDIIVNKMFSPLRLTRMVWDLAVNLLDEIAKETTNSEDNLKSSLLLESFPEMMRGIAEKISTSEVATIEEKLPKLAFSKGKEILEKNLKTLKIAAIHLDKKIENKRDVEIDVEMEESFVITSQIKETQQEADKKKIESLKRKRSSEDTQETVHKKQKIEGATFDSEKELPFFKLKDREEKLAYLKTEILQYEKILENAEESGNKLKEIGMESARSSILIEKQLFLDNFLEKNDLFLFNQETFEMKVTVKGIFYVLNYLNFFEAKENSS